MYLHRQLTKCFLIKNKKKQEVCVKTKSHSEYFVISKNKKILNMNQKKSLN